MSIDSAKKAAAILAADLIKDKTIVGLGTGTTVFFFIERLIERVKQGLDIQAVATSTQSKELASQGRIPILDINEVKMIDITVDGADEIDPLKRMIKGGGGAHVREKIVASLSKEMIVIVDETKVVLALGKTPLPVEILPFGYKATLHHLEKLSYKGTLRYKNQDKTLFVTENGNYIFDIHFNGLRENPERDHEAIIHLPGVVDSGFFFNLAGRVIIGFLDGQVVIKN